MVGRYPDFNVLEQADHWDDVTREVVLGRVEEVPPIRFFTAAEATTLGAFCDRAMAQDREPKIPVLNMIDAKLFAGSGEGYRFAELPEDSATWRRVARGLDAAARQHGSCGLQRSLARDSGHGDPGFLRGNAPWRGLGRASTPGAPGAW